MTTLIVRPSMDKKPYRLKCRFKIEAYPGSARLDREKVKVAEQFVADMKKQGWEHDLRTAFVMKGPLPRVVPVTIRPRHMPTALEMLPRVLRGERFLDNGYTGVTEVPLLNSSEWWEYEIKGVFIRDAMQTEYPDAHEEELRY